MTKQSTSQLDQWLFQKSENKYQFGLQRMQVALNFFHSHSFVTLVQNENFDLNMHQKKTFVQVLGTNGKGSTVAFLSSILIKHNINVCSYTSPHLISILERFEYNQKFIAKNLYYNLLCVLKKCEDDHHIKKLSYFETTVCLAYLFFYCTDSQVCILEAGLGGRLDATSAIAAPYKLFTQIDLDHQTYLGDTILDIASEKLAVIDKDDLIFSCPQTKNVTDLLKKTVRKKMAYLKNIQQNQTSTLQALDLIKQKLNLNLKGKHQYYNATLALNAAKTMIEQLKITKQTNASFDQTLGFEAIEKTKLNGRSQTIIHQNKTYYLDVAHNLHACKGIVEFLKNNPIDIVCISILKDKDWQSMLDACHKHSKSMYICPTEHERSWSLQDVQNYTEEKNYQNVQIFKSANQMFNTINKQTQAKHVLCFGSFYFIGPILDSIKK